MLGTGYILLLALGACCAIGFCIHGGF